MTTGGAALPAGAWREGRARVGDATLHYVEAGAGPLELLLHGCPDSPHTGRFQLPALAAAGHRVVAPFLRGYGASSRPDDVASYRLDALADDVAGLVAALGAATAAAVVGHDWGGSVAWRLAAREPRLVERLVVVNSPHPRTLLRALRSPRQQRRSWYMLFFQLPRIPEWLLGAHHLAVLHRSILAEVRRPGAFTDADWAWQRAALEPPGALRAAIDYYRAAARGMLAGRRDARAGGPVTVPTLVLWGDRDHFLLPELAERQAACATRVTVRRFPQAGHWVHWDAADDVTAVLLAWLRTA